MNQTTMMHRIASVNLGPVEKQDQEGRAYYTRLLVIKGHNGAESVLHMFSDWPAALMTDEEKRRQAEPIEPAIA